MAIKAKKTKTKRTKRATSKRATQSASKPTANKKPVARPESLDKALRDHVIFVLRGGGAHVGFDDTLRDWPLQFAGIKVAKFPHTAWMLLEHIRLAQWDILEFSRNSKYVSPKWPEGYWPESVGPPNEAAWKASMDACRNEMDAMDRLVADPKVDLYAEIPWGDGQTILREALLMADHNAYHLGQLMMLRKSLGI